MDVAVYVLAGVSVVMSVLLFLRVPAPKGFMTWIPKLAAGALSPLWAAMGLLGLVLGLARGLPAAAVGGAAGLAVMLGYIWSVAKGRGDFEAGFGADWRQRIRPQRAPGLLKRRWMGLLVEPATIDQGMQKDVPFWSIPESGRQLLCDLWLPPPGTASSGMAMIFFHGSAWYFLDKDFGTRPFFRHLVSQGHVVMDVAYRLCPEVDVFEMVGDVKRAVAWMKANGERHGVHADRIVLAGASAGGHLSLLAAYAPQHPLLTPDEVKQVDLSVRGVISFYGPSDLRAVYTHTNQQNLVGLPKVATGSEAASQGKKNMRDAGRLDILVGGHPPEVPELYDLASPITHVHAGCPATLLIQGRDDLITPAAATRSLYRQLIQLSVPAVNIEFACTDHGFDLLLPVISPSYQAALYNVDRFLAILE